MRATLALFRRTRLFAMTTKNGPKGYYKGTRTGKMGRHTKQGGYVVEYWRVRSYVPPEIEKDCKLTPFVTKKVDEVRGQYPEAPIKGSYYLNKWKAENGED